MNVCTILILKKKHINKNYNRYHLKTQYPLTKTIKNKRPSRAKKYWGTPPRTAPKAKALRGIKILASPCARRMGKRGKGRGEAARGLPARSRIGILNFCLSPGNKSLVLCPRHRYLIAGVALQSRKSRKKASNYARRRAMCRGIDQLCIFAILCVIFDLCAFLDVCVDLEEI